MLRYRGKKIQQTVKELDSFSINKINRTYVKQTPLGGAVTILISIFVLWIIIAETLYFLDTDFVFTFVPDADFDDKLKINLDITIAMPCHSLGADIIDSTNQNMILFGELQEEETWFELDPAQKNYFDSMRHVNSYLTEEFHAVQNLLWKSRFISTFTEIPKRRSKPSEPPDACRIHGSLTLNKVAGNLHVTAGKSLALPGGHIHLTMFGLGAASNFSHRIDRFSFGDPSPGIIHPLESELKITDQEQMLYQYFIDVVPTDVDTLFSSMRTFQYSVKELSRAIDHDVGSHGMSGVFFKYNTNALKVIVRETRDPFIEFFIRLSGVLGGVYIVTGILKNFLDNCTQRVAKPPAAS
ncbi:hypothetical protein WDU94_007677 [Cyamophila willieti]